MILLEIIFALILTYLALAGLYQSVLALAAFRKNKKGKLLKTKDQSILVLVPAYACDQVILNSVKKNMDIKLSYSKANFDYTVIADRLKKETIHQLRSLGAKVHEVSFEKSTKVKALQSAISANQDHYDAVVILDADNIIENNFLSKSNKYLNQGFEIIQGNRMAANKNSAFALLDGLSETANTKMLCEGANRLGLSSKLSGSGMVFTYALFKEAIMQMEAIGGFDKELELYFTSKGHFIYYVDDLIVLDEKIDDSEAFARQRGRWLQAQYNFFKQSIKPAVKQLLKGNIDYFHKTMQLALPPRALSPFVLFFVTALSMIMGLETATIIGLIGFTLTIGSYLMVLSFKELLINSTLIMKALPRLFISVLKSLAIMKKAKKEFIHTQHKVLHHDAL